MNVRKHGWVFPSSMSTVASLFGFLLFRKAAPYIKRYLPSPFPLNGPFFLADPRFSSPRSPWHSPPFALRPLSVVCNLQTRLYQFCRPLPPRLPPSPEWCAQDLLVSILAIFPPRVPTLLAIRFPGVPFMADPRRAPPMLSAFGSYK